MSLKLVDCTDAGGRQALLQSKDLGIVGSDDQNVLERERRLDSVSINPAGVGLHDFIDERADAFDFLG